MRRAMMIVMAAAAVLAVGGLLWTGHGGQPWAQAATALSAGQTATAGTGGVTSGRFVKIETARTSTTNETVIHATAVTDAVVGVCELTASAAGMTRYAPPGTVTTVTAGESIAVGDMLTTGANGYAYAVDTDDASNQRICGLALTAASTGSSTTIVVLAGYAEQRLAITGDLTIGTTGKLALRDTGSYIYSSAANTLRLNADSRIISLIPITGVNETITAIDANTSIDANATGRVYGVTTTAIVSLPACAGGLTYTFFSDAADGTAQISLSPASGDNITGCGTTGATAKDLRNTLATAKRGDYVTIVGGSDANSWYITRKSGTWAWEP